MGFLSGVLVAPEGISLPPATQGSQPPPNRLYGIGGISGKSGLTTPEAL